LKCDTFFYGKDIYGIEIRIGEINDFSYCCTLLRDLPPTSTYFDMPKIQGIRKTQKPGKNQKNPKIKRKNPKTQLPMSFS
jgi:hypothetical protein